MHVRIAAAALAATSALVLLATPGSAQTVSAAEGSANRRYDGTSRLSGEETAIQ